MSDDAMRLPSYPTVLALGTRGTERLLEEEGETIREDLFRMHVKDLLRTAGRGLPEWHKERLAERVGEVG